VIEIPAARALAEQIEQIEERLGRLLVSGWRQAGPEAADLRNDADALVEAGLPELAARVAAVADAGGPAEALRAIALAKSACRLFRARLPVQGPPDNWSVLAPPKPSKRPKAGATTDTLVPISRLLLEGREVWVCSRLNRNQILLVEPPFPVEETAAMSAAPPEPTGVFGRLRRQIGQVLGGDTSTPSPWLHHRLRGTLRWRAQYPLGVQGDVGCWTLDNPSWEKTESNAQDVLHGFHLRLSTVKLEDNMLVFWNVNGFRIKQLERDDPASYIWLDPSAAEAFGQAPTPKLWAITWTEGKAEVPLALLTPGSKARPPRLTHLIPGLPEDLLVHVTEA
jgi:hypothetical protein